MARVVQHSVQVTCDICSGCCNEHGYDSAKIQIQKGIEYISLDLCSAHTAALEAWLEQQKSEACPTPD